MLFLISPKCATCPAHQHSNNILRRVQIITLLIMQFSPADYSSLLSSNILTHDLMNGSDFDERWWQTTPNMTKKQMVVLELMTYHRTRYIFSQLNILCTPACRRINSATRISVNIITHRCLSVCWYTLKIFSLVAPYKAAPAAGETPEYRSLRRLESAALSCAGLALVTSQADSTPQTASSRQRDTSQVLWLRAVRRTSQTFRRNVQPHPSRSKSKPRKATSKLTYLLLAYSSCSSTLKLWEVRSSETSVNYQTTRSHISGDRTRYIVTFVWTSNPTWDFLTK
jgi:hypothetical protein